MASDGVSLGVALTRLLQGKGRVSPSADGIVVLEESQAGMRVEISNPPETLVAINVEALGHLSNLNEGEWNRICDYLLVAQYDDEVFACLVELKTTLTNERDPREQLRRSLPIWEYLRSACEVECQSSRGWPSSFVVSYSLVAAKRSPRLDKQPVRRLPSDWPEEELHENITIKKFVRDRIPFSMLV